MDKKTQFIMYHMVLNRDTLTFECVLYTDEDAVGGVMMVAAQQKWPITSLDPKSTDNNITLFVADPHGPANEVFALRRDGDVAHLQEDTKAFVAQMNAMLAKHPKATSLSVH